jgi:hypothetical protein
VQGSKDQVNLVVHGKGLALGLELTQARPGLFERCGGAVALVFDPRQLLAQVAIGVGSLRGFVFPVTSAVSDFGPLAHEALPGQDSPSQATADRSAG